MIDRAQPDDDGRRHGHARGHRHDDGHEPEPQASNGPANGSDAIDDGASNRAALAGQSKRHSPRTICGSCRGCSHIRTMIATFRASIESAVREQQGEIDVVAASTIDVCLKWQAHSLLARHWLAAEADTLSAADRLSFLCEVARGASERDRALRMLGLRRAGDRNAYLEDAFSQCQRSAGDGSRGRCASRLDVRSKQCPQ